MRQPKVGDTVRWAEDGVPKSGMVISIMRSNFIAQWNGEEFEIVPSPDEYIVDIACADGVRLVGKAQLTPKSPG